MFRQRFGLSHVHKGHVEILRRLFLKFSVCVSQNQTVIREGLFQSFLALQGEWFFYWVARRLIWFPQICRELLSQLVRKLCVACKLVRHRCMIAALFYKTHIRCVMQDWWIIGSFLISLVMVDEAGEILFEFCRDCSSFIDDQLFAFFADEHVLPRFQIISEWGKEYEYLCGSWENMRLR